MKIEIERPCLVLKNLYSCSHCQKLVLLIIFVESVILCFQDSLMNKCSN